MKTRIICFFSFIIFFIWSCASDPNFDNIPQIEFVSFSKDSMVQNNLNTDSVLLTIAFQDGDGDIGTGTTGINENIIITDLRTNVIYSRFKIPELDVNAPGKGIEGEITMKVFTTCCIFLDGIPPCEKPTQFPSNDLQLGIEMIDDNGNKSNLITTPSIQLLCQ